MRFCDWISGVGRPMNYYPDVAKAVGSAKAAIFLCFLVWRDKNLDGNVCINSRKVVSDFTGLSYAEARGAERALTNIGWIRVKVHRIDHVSEYEIIENQIDDDMDAYQDYKRLGKDGEWKPFFRRSITGRKKPIKGFPPSVNLTLGEIGNSHSRVLN